jgi:hypothetical protein
MENIEIAPHPVNSIEDLLAKLDLIHEAAKQYSTKSSDDELGLVLLHRAVELMSDISIIDPAPEHWQTVGEKLEGIREAVRQGTINDLNAMYALD